MRRSEQIIATALHLDAIVTVDGLYNLQAVRVLQAVNMGDGRPVHAVPGCGMAPPNTSTLLRNKGFGPGCRRHTHLFWNRRAKGSP